MFQPWGAHWGACVQWACFFRNEAWTEARNIFMIKFQDHRQKKINKR
jgi:hypothetical protein